MKIFRLFPFDFYFNRNAFSFRPQNLKLKAFSLKKRLLSSEFKNAIDQKWRVKVLNKELFRLLRKSFLAYKIIDSKKPMWPCETITRIRNRCVLTGHAQTIGHFGFSRIALRNLARLGLISGLVKV